MTSHVDIATANISESDAQKLLRVYSYILKRARQRKLELAADALPQHVEFTQLDIPLASEIHDD